MNEMLDRSSNNFEDGSSRESKENVDLAWDMAHAEKPYQDAAIEAKEKAYKELETASGGMSDDLSLKVQENNTNDMAAGAIRSYAAGSEEDQVVKLAQHAQEEALSSSQKLIEDVKNLKNKAKKASDEQLEIYELTQNIESELRTI